MREMDQGLSLSHAPDALQEPAPSISVARDVANQIMPGLLDPYGAIADFGVSESISRTAMNKEAVLREHRANVVDLEVGKWYSPEFGSTDPMEGII